MKVVSLTTVKNECDILESFVRYSLLYVDEMYIVMTRCGDNSPRIIQNLCNEGLPLHVFYDNTFELNYLNNINALLDLALQSSPLPDWILPLDADEFYIPHKHPRAVLQELPTDSIYTVLWKTFIPTASDDRSELFIPRRIRHVRDDAHENVHKLLFPGRMAMRSDFRIGMGGHELAEKILEPKELVDFRLGHFPVRSVGQMKQKLLVNVLTDIAMPTKSPGRNYHWYSQLYALLNGEGLDAHTSALHYACGDERVAFSSYAIDDSFCSTCRIVYPDLATPDPAACYVDAAVHFVETRASC